MFADAWNGLGIALHALARDVEAVSAYEAALRARSEDAGSLANLAASQHALGRDEEAVASCRLALKIDPDHAGAQGNLGSALAARGRHAEALDCFEAAARLKPDSADAAYNAGIALQALGRPAETIAWFARAQELDPGHVEAHLNEAFARLALGDYEGGWPRYEWRWRRAAARSALEGLSGKPWTGKEVLEGRSIHLFCEQGLGDAIQFVRYAPLVAARGARVVLEAHPWLAPLLAGVRGVSAVIEQGRARPRRDYHCSLLSLPLAFGTTLGTIPSTVPYIAVPAERRETWRPRMAAIERPRIGFALAGNPDTGRHRFVPLREFLSSLAASRVAFVNLHKGTSAADAELIARKASVIDLGREFHDFADAAAAIEHLDLVIAIDTSVAHVAGALDKSTWILLPAVSEWRWLTEREDSPWYPSVRLFRQSSSRSWAPVIERVAGSLAARDY